MKTKNCDVAIIGGGPAGMAAALSARKNGANKVILIERDRELGGILQQCIHNGFGLHRFHQELTGPGYAQRNIREVYLDPGIEVMLDTMVLEAAPDHRLLTVSPLEGLIEIVASAIVLTMGCRERTRGAIRIPGSRPAGVYTAGAAQRMVNMEGYLPGKEVVILGSGDIGLIMARRMTLEGAKVKAVLEIMPHSNGLTRNIVQCLEDYNIPLFLSHTITSIRGKNRVTGIACAKVDENRCPIPGTEFEITCDCLLLSVGLVPENELSQGVGILLDTITGGPMVDQCRATTQAGFFAAGNVVHVHDLVDWVSEEGDIAGKYAALYAQGKKRTVSNKLSLKQGAGVRSVVPQSITVSEEADSSVVRLFVRASEPIRKAKMLIVCGEDVLFERVLPVVKPSEMVVTDVPWEKLLKAQEEVTVIIRKQR